MFAVAACVLLASSAAVHGRVAFPPRTVVPPGWVAGGASPKDAVVPLMFAVKQRNVDKLMQIVDDVSTPSSPSYGQHLSLAELKDLLYDKEATATVRAFLAQYPVLSTKETINEELITVTVTVATAEAMLGASYVQWSNEELGLTLHRVPSYSMPEDVAAAVDFVGHTTRLTALRRNFVVTSYRTEAANGTSTPQVVMEYYGITNNRVATLASSNSVFETIGQSYAPSDLQLFDKVYSIPAPKFVNVIGANDPSSCSNPDNCIEAELDVQLITAIAQESNTTFWSVPGSESFFEWISAVASTTKPPLVHSISYGEYEEPSQDNRFDTELAKLAARGLSVLTSSGDDGVAGYEARGNPAACGFNPQYPASAPHITTVGATQGPEDNKPEITCQSDAGGVITSGGGFSNVFARPSYQDAAVQAYLANPAAKLPPASDFNAKGRGYPDVAFMGHNFPIYVGGSYLTGSGTSASSPLFAGIVTLANAQRILVGKKPLGFLNPVLYSLSSDIFTDVTVGENNCAAALSNPTCCQYGFTATQGWDATTGLGSVKYPAFLKAVVNLP